MMVKLNAVLLTVIVLQWILLYIVVLKRHHGYTSSSSKGNNGNSDNSDSILLSTSTRTSSLSSSSSSSSSSSNNHLPSGVAATLILRAPKWFHLRYKYMIDNALNNIPSHWKIQVFLNDQWATQARLFDWHPGLYELLHQHPRVILTLLPANLTNAKPKQVFTSPWFWNSMATSDTILLFGGNGAFCGNHPMTQKWQFLNKVDFCGVPLVHQRDKMAGDGSSHSWRSKHSMLQVLDYAQRHDDIQLDNHGHDVVKILRRINREAPGTFQLATPEQTQLFGGVHNVSSDSGVTIRLPLVVAGTQASLSYQQRDTLLKHCPELKAIFPSLHEPSCFGAHPDPVTCQASICALQDHIPGHGC